MSRLDKIMRRNAVSIKPLDYEVIGQTDKRIFGHLRYDEKLKEYFFHSSDIPLGADFLESLIENLRAVNEKL